MENHLDFIVIKAEPKFRADSFVPDEADCSAAPVETGIVPVTLSLYACDKRDTAARRAWDNFGVVTEMVPLGLLSGCLLLPQAYEDADVLIDDCLYLDQPLGEMVDQLTAHGYDCENTFIITDVLLTPAAHNQDVLDAIVTRLPETLFLTHHVYLQVLAYQPEDHGDPLTQPVESNEKWLNDQLEAAFWLDDACCEVSRCGSIICRRVAMPKTDAAKLPIITFKPFISERGFELLANAVVEQAVHDYKRLLHRIYVKGEHNPKAWYDLVELEQFFCSKRFSQFTALDGRALIERIRGEMNL